MKDIKEKVWTIQKNDDGTGLIMSYKGEETDIVFPQEVDGVKIVGIANRKGKTPAIYSQITSVEIPKGYEIIGSSAFLECVALKSVKIPFTVQRIGNKAFMGCSSLETVVIPPRICDTFDCIGKWMFRDCVELKDVYVLNQDWEIRDSAAFRGCEKVRVHCLSDSKIKQRVKKNQFEVMSEEELKSLAEEYYGETYSEIEMQLKD